MTERTKFPQEGIGHDDIIDKLKHLKGNDADWENARTWSLVYHVGDEHKQLLADASNMFLSANLLNPVAFKSLKQMEAEVVSMTTDMLNGSSDTVGVMTTGGTESILMACKAARDRKKAKKPWKRWSKGEIIAPETLHVAFDKAAHYFGMKVRRIPVRSDYRADVRAMKKAINSNTVLIAGSAPQYVHGMIDPIEELGRVALEHDIPFHVDACFGGFMLPWLEALGEPVPRWDFRVPGVTSISADLHKYGYAAKGASVVLYKNMDYLKHQFFISTDWSGGIYASPSMPGTRAGGPIAAAWASMMALGRDGYIELARTALEAKVKLERGIEAIDDLEVIGSRDCTIVTWRSRSRDVDTFAIADQLVERGWSVDRQAGPPSIHCTVNANHLPVIDTYLADLRECVAIVRAHPELAKTGEAALYGMMAKVPVRGAVRMSVRKVMEKMYAPDAVMPDLANLSEDGDPLFAAMDKYGEKAMQAWDRVKGLRARLPL